MFDSFGAPIWGNDAYGNKTLAVTPKAHLVWVKGISTAELADNAEILRNIVFKVTGTKTYETADAGIRTLFVLEPLTSVNSP